MSKVVIDKVKTGQNIMSIRINNKYTKKEFADILGLKSDKQVDRWEKGVSIPSVKSIINICNFLSIRPDDVLVFSVFNGKMYLYLL